MLSSLRRQPGCPGRAHDPALLSAFLEDVTAVLPGGYLLTFWPISRTWGVAPWVSASLRALRNSLHAFSTAVLPSHEEETKIRPLSPPKAVGLLLRSGENHSRRASDAMQAQARQNFDARTPL